MLSSLIKTINLGTFLRQSTCFPMIKFNFSNGQTLNSDAKFDDSKIVLTEEQPEIPPNYGFPGDENIRSIYEIKKINRSFQYGSPPRLKRRFIRGAPVIRLMPITSCSNRRFFRIAVTREKCDLSDGFIEDLGSIDPMPNRDNNILVALNIDRIKYYLSKSTPLKGKVGEILGLAGLLPVHPGSYLTAYRNRRRLEQKNEPEKEQAKAEN